MTIPLNDPALLSLLASVHSPTDFVAPDGRVVGTFTPPPQIDLKTVKPGISDEEYLRRVQDTSTQGYTGEEVLRHLRNLPCSN